MFTVTYDLQSSKKKKMKLPPTFFLLAVFVILLAACDSNANNNTPRSGPLGTRVEIQGGAYTNISPVELNALLVNKKFPLINVHIPYEGEIGKTDAFIAYDVIEKNLNKLPQDKSAQVVLYCQSGRMSQIAAEKLVKLGYTNIWNLDRGMLGWQQAGFPILEKQQP